MTQYTTGGTTTITVGTTTITGGSDGDILYNNGGVVGGFPIYDDTGTGDGAFALRKSQSGAAATSNTLEVSATFPAVLSAQTSLIRFAPTFVTQNQQQLGLNITTVSSGANITIAHAAALFSNSQQGVGTVFLGAFGTSTVAHGIFAEATNTTGRSIGVHGLTSGSTAGATMVGVLGEAAATAGVHSIGVWGNAATSTGNTVGGFFSVGGASTAPTLTDAALIADNVAVAADIFVARDNGTAVFTVADGGLVTATNFVRISGGELALNADYTNATAVMSNTALSTTLVSGRTYSFTACLFFANSTAADGCLIDFDGGSATVTNFRAHAHAANAVGAALAFTTANSTALATDIDVTLALTTQAMMTIQGTFVPSANGTFIMRASEKVDGGGTLTIFRGSWLNIRDANAI